MKRFVALLLAVVAVTAFVSPVGWVYSVEVENDLPVLPVRLIARKAEDPTVGYREGDWQIFKSEIVNINVDGRYTAVINIPEALNITNLSNLALRTDGATFEWDEVEGGRVAYKDAVPVPDVWRFAKISFDNIRINDTLVGNTFGSRMFCSPYNEEFDMFAQPLDAELWSGWWEPGQYLTDVSVFRPGGEGTVASFGHLSGDVITSVTLDFIVDSGTIPQYVPPRSHGTIPSDLTAGGVVAQMGIGWNLGNTFDAYLANLGLPAGYAVNHRVGQLEMVWGDNIVTQSLIDRLYEEGFDTVRIPVTWHKVADPDDDYRIRGDFLDYVQSAVNMAYNKGMYVIINSHHDDRFYCLDEADASSGLHEGNRFVTNVWRQVAERFKDYDEKLIFEIMNEPHICGNSHPDGCVWSVGTLTARDNVNYINQAAVDVIRGNNAAVYSVNNQRRIIMAPTYAASTHSAALSGFIKPTDPSGNDRIIMSVHSYDPFEWAHNGNGSYPGIKQVSDMLDVVKARADALGLPVVMGEWGSSETLNGSSETLSVRTGNRAIHARDYVIECFSRGIVPIVWDDGGTFRLFDRKAPHNSYYPDIVKGIMSQNVPRKPAFKLGCVIGNADVIAIADAVQILMYLAGNPVSVINTDTTGRARLAADINGDDNIKIDDAVQVLMYLAKNPECLIER